MSTKMNKKRRLNDIDDYDDTAQSNPPNKRQKLNINNNYYKPKPFDDSIHSNMQQLIPIINKLQDVFAIDGVQSIDLPQIAVIGSQSVGKSSVIENIVGRDFLPRGCNIVTRTPLILQLFNTSINNNNNNNNNNNKQQENELTWGEFLHSGSKKYYNFDEIRKEIKRETNRLAPNKTISDEVIRLKIYSPFVLNLTLIDLPGMTKVAIANQPSDIEYRIKKLINSFISKPNCLILAVSSATMDLATSDAIQLAKQVDPNGKRTLGVITKIDLMDKGTNALQILKGNVIPLQLGYIGVVNRSQKDINNNKCIDDAQLSEKLFFKNNIAYKPIAHMCGTPYLAYKLNQILINHIKICLPNIIQSINYRIQYLGMNNDINDDNKGALLLHLIAKFCECFNDSIDGSKYDNKLLFNNSNNSNNSNDNISQQLFGGARILHIFETEFIDILNKMSAFDGLSDEFIFSSMRNACGVHSSLFIPEMCFQNLLKTQIEKLRVPCMLCVDLVFNELKRIASQSEIIEITKFSKFRQALNDTVTNVLKRFLDPCKIFINQIIDNELAYINTNHPEFISMNDIFIDISMNNNNNDKIESLPLVIAHNNDNKRGWGSWFWGTEQKQKQKQASNSSNSNYNNNTKLCNISAKQIREREQLQLSVIKKFMASYFAIVQKNIGDLIPKSVMCMLVNKSKQTLQHELTLALYKQDKFEQLLYECPQIKIERKAVHKALQIINEIKQYQVI